MDWNQLAQALIILLGGIISCSLVFLGIRLFFADKTEYEINKKITKSIQHPIKGKLNTSHNGDRSYRISAGIAINTKSNTWVNQGKLSEEAIDNVFR